MTIQFEKLCQECQRDWKQTKRMTSLEMYKVHDIKRKHNEEQITNLMGYIKEYKNDTLSPDKMKRIVLDWMNHDDILKMKYLDKDIQHDFLAATQLFVKDARSFDKEITDGDIAQAMRNVWIFLMLGLLLGKGIQYHKGIFAYSMLYPYTDNYLDDITITTAKKIQFNKRLRERLRNIPYENPDSTEKKMDTLIEMIEEVYPRTKYSDVYESLLCIQDGQEYSVLQQKSEHPDLLMVSVRKGGASVLADGFLIDGTLTYSQQLFCMKYGFFLQLADDLQDIEEDKQHEHYTLLSTLKDDGDGLVARLLKFTAQTMKDEVIQSKDYAYIVEFDCILLMLMAILQNQSYFTEVFLREVTDCMPVSMAFMNDLKKTMKKMDANIDMKQIIVSMAVS